MKNKKLIAAIVAASLIAVVGVGTTLAYFTDRDEAHNVLTLGAVDIELTEPNYIGDENCEGLLPGDVIPKDPTVTLAEDSEDAYVRMQLTIEGLNDAAVRDLMAGDQDTVGLLEQIRANGWYYNEAEGYYYYNEKLTADNRTAVFFEQVNIPCSWDNQFADAVIKVIVSAEAIQADHFTPIVETVAVGSEEVQMITSWTFTDGTQITGDYITTYEAGTY